MDYISGLIYDGTFFRGYVGIEDGVVAEVGEGRSPERGCAEGIVVPGLVNCHTHMGDAGLRLDRKYGLEELVAPPDGLKHVYLRRTPPEAIRASAEWYIERSVSNGVTRLADFREGGAEGCRIVSGISGGALILGRPVSEEYDPNEVDRILGMADGIGIPSVSDMPADYTDALADHARRAGKIFALHASERVREDIEAVLSLGPDLVVHMTEASDADMRRCSDSGVPVVVCPSSSAYFGKAPPVRRLLDAGVTVGLGTDNAMLCGPDLRREAAAVGGMLKDPALREVSDILLDNGRKILYHGTGMGVQKGMPADLAVFPLGKGRGIGDILDSTGTVLTTEWRRGDDVQEDTRTD